MAIEESASQVCNGIMGGGLGLNERSVELVQVFAEREKEREITCAPV